MKVSEYHKYDSYGAANVSGWIKNGETLDWRITCLAY